MSGERPTDYLTSLVRELCALPRETEWVEFKINDAEPQAIGEYISALANAAALAGKAFAYLVWGVRDDDHTVVGTTFDPYVARVGNEELESWLLRLLDPKLGFRFFAVDIAGQRIVLLEIARAARHPVRFSGQEFVRVGTYKKKLKDFPEKERALWRIFDQTPFEDGVAAERATGERDPEGDDEHHAACSVRGRGTQPLNGLPVDPGGCVRWSSPACRSELCT